MNRPAWGRSATWLCMLLACTGVCGRDAAAGEDPVRNVRVWFGAIEGAPADGEVALSVSGGGRVLFTTRPAPAKTARWQHSIRVYTEREQPLEFRLVRPVKGREAPVRVAPSRAPAERPAKRRHVDVRRQDQVLAEGFDDLVADFDSSGPGRAVPEDDRIDLPSPRPTRESSMPPDAGGTTLCRVRLAWPPEDGTHRLSCGAMTIVVRTKRLPERTR